MGVDSDQASGKVTLLKHALWRRRCKLQLTNPKLRPLSTPIFGIFASLELSRSTRLITSVAKRRRKDVEAFGTWRRPRQLLERFSQFQKTRARTRRRFPIMVIQEAGLDGFWIHRAPHAEGIESYVVAPASIATSCRSRRED